MTLGETQAHFKKNEDVEVIAPLMEDERLRAGVVAWKSVVVTFKDNEPCGEGLSDAAQWEWMWSKVEFDSRSFGIVAGCKAQETSDLFARMKGLRLIYPDGTIHQLATKYLQAMIMAKLPKQK